MGTPKQDPSLEEVALAHLQHLPEVHAMVKAALAQEREKATAAEDKMLRALAEAENQQRRLAAEQANRIRFANEKLMLDMLTTFDSLELCLTHAEPGAHLDDVRKGIEMTLSQFRQALRNAGVEAIEADRGKSFDPKVHEAVMQGQDAQVPKGAIAQVIQTGFVYRDRVLRAAKVTVSTGP